MSHTVTVVGGYFGHRTVDQYAFGAGKLRVAVLSEDDLPLHRQVYLFVEEDYRTSNLRHGFNRLIASGWSDPETGLLEFRELDLSRKYRAEASDRTGEFDPVIKGGLVAEPPE